MHDHNSIRAALEADEAVLGARALTRSPLLVEVYGDLGLDFVWIDLEHGGPSPFDAGALEELTRAADVADIELLVRVPAGDPPLIRKVLDTSVRTVLVPRVETAAAVRSAVSASRFTYDGGPGDRGVATARTSAWGDRAPDFTDREDGSTLVGVMIENTTALDNLDDILAVPGLGFAFVGPADLSVSLGRPLAFDDPAVRSAIDDIRDACLGAGVPVGCIRTDPAGARTALESGYQIVRIGGEVDAVRSVIAQRLAAIG